MDFLVGETLKHYHYDPIEENNSKRKRLSIPVASSSGISSSIDSTARKRVARYEDVELVNVRKKKKSSFGTHFQYGKAKEKTIDIKKHVRRSPWYLFVALLMRLFFMDRGVWEYFQTHEQLEQMNREIVSGKQEIRQLQEEILLIRTSKSYQKKLARDHLGVIGADEYLVLFAQEGTSQSI